jgi:hypothetical protein
MPYSHHIDATTDNKGDCADVLAIVDFRVRILKICACAYQVYQANNA